MNLEVRAVHQKAQETISGGSANPNSASLRIRSFQLLVSSYYDHRLMYTKNPILIIQAPILISHIRKVQCPIQVRWLPCTVGFASRRRWSKTSSRSEQTVTTTTTVPNQGKLKNYLVWGAW